MINLSKVKVSKEVNHGNRAGSPRYTLDWNDYYSHDVINEFIDELAATYPNVTTVSVGTTYEGRDMRAIQVNRAGPDAPNIWVEAGTGIESKTFGIVI